MINSAFFPLTYMFSDLADQHYPLVADPNQLIVQVGLLSNCWNQIRLPENVKIDTWDNDSTLLFPLHTALYHHIYEPMQAPDDAYDMVYCIGSPLIDYSSFFDMIFVHSKFICMDDDALRQWELYFGEHNECTSIHVYNNVNYYIFDMILFFNHTLQQYLIQNDTNSILDLLDTFSSIVKQSVDHNIIGAKICFSTGDLSRADYFMKQAFSLDPLNPGLMQLYRDLKKPIPGR